MPINRRIPLPGLTIGNAQDQSALTGVTVMLTVDGAVAGMDVRGFAAGTRQCDSLDVLHVVQRVHGLCFAGGSAFGTGASTGVLDYLAEREIGQNTVYAQVPIVPCAVVFDLGLGDARARPTPQMARQACESASADYQVGAIGAGTGIAVGKYLGIEQAMKSGIGSASVESGELIVFALAVVNAFGCVYDPTGCRPVAGARDPQSPGEIFTPDRLAYDADSRLGPVENTVLVAVFTNAALDKIEANRVARMAQAGMARCVVPAWSPYDGDIVFALSLGQVSADQTRVGVLAADAVSGAIIDAVRSAPSGGGLISATEFGSA
ncbi:MAG: P1 family peptidase [Candidatus Alcyoniella australis]|nr:P1 family peptidase [Candidatus Alcyoniella australis]